MKQIAAKDVAKFVYEDICCKFGVPLELLFDQGPGFRADLMDYLCAKMKIKRRFTTPYYPRCNGLNERFNGELVQMLTKVTEHQGKNWDLHVIQIEWYSNKKAFLIRKRMPIITIAGLLFCIRQEMLVISFTLMKQSISTMKQNHF